MGGFRDLRMSKGDLREFSGMLIPIMVEQLFVATINLVISFIIRQSGTAAVATVGLLGSVNMMLNQVVMSIGVGVSVVVAQYRGRNDVKGSGMVAQQGITLGVLLGVLVTSVCLPLREPLLRLLLADSEALVYEYSRVYFTYCLLSVPFLAIFSIASAALRGSGHPRSSLISVVVHSGSYALMAYLVTEFTDLGLTGVSIALFASAVLSAGVGFALLLKGNENLRVTKIFVKLDMDVIKPMLVVGIPVMIENLFFSLGRLITQTFSVPYGTEAMAANGIVNTINNIMAVPISASVNAAAPIIGRYCGMGDKKEAMRKAKQLIILIVIVMTALCIGVAIFINPISWMLTDEASVMSMVKQILQLKVFAFPVFYTLSFLMPAAMRSSGDAKFVLYVNTGTMIAIRICLAYILTGVLHIGIIGIWIGQYSDWIVRLFFFAPRFFKGKWLDYSLLRGKPEAEAVK